MKRNNLKISNEFESNVSVYFTFEEIWKDYLKFFMNKKKVLDLGGQQQINMEPFPSIIYSKIHTLLFPGELISSSFDFQDEQIEKLNLLFGEGVYMKSGWCYNKNISVDNNTTLWWIIRIKVNFQPLKQKLIFTLYSKSTLNGRLMTPESK